MAELRLPTMDFSILGNLPQTYRSAQADRMKMDGERARRLALSELGQQSGPLDYDAAARKLLAAGDREGAMSLATLGMRQGEQQYQRTRDASTDQFRNRQLDIQERGLAQRAPNELERRAIAGGLQPGTPAFQEFMLRGGRNADVSPSAVDKKEIFKAEDELPQLQGTVEALDRALALNDKTFQGATAGARGWIGANLPGGGALVDKNAALATEEWSKIMGPEALQVMASTLKGATTDFELRKFMDMLGNPDTAPNIRKSIINRMKTLAQRKLELSNRRVQDLRGGSYFKPGGSAPAPAAQPAPSQGQFRDGQRARNGQGQVIEFRGGQWVPVQ